MAGGTEGINMLEVESNALLYFPTYESEESQLDLQDWPEVETIPSIKSTSIPHMPQ